MLNRNALSLSLKAVCLHNNWSLQFVQNKVITKIVLERILLWGGDLLSDIILQFQGSRQLIKATDDR